MPYIDSGRLWNTSNIGTRAPFSAENYFWGAVLSSLDIVGGMVVGLACVTKILRLHGTVCPGTSYHAFRKYYRSYGPSFGRSYHDLVSVN